jgi:hypothetical protein
MIIIKEICLLAETIILQYTAYTIEGSKALLNSKLPLIKKAVVSQIYSAMGLTQKAGANNTATILSAFITNEIDNSTSSSTHSQIRSNAKYAEIRKRILSPNHK